VLQTIARVFVLAAVVVTGARAYALEPAGMAPVPLIGQHLHRHRRRRIGLRRHDAVRHYAFRMTNWTAQTRENRISVSSYAFEDKTISGSSAPTNRPSGWATTVT